MLYGHQKRPLQLIVLHAVSRKRAQMEAEEEAAGVWGREPVAEKHRNQHLLKLIVDPSCYHEELAPPKIG